MVVFHHHVYCWFVGTKGLIRSTQVEGLLNLITQDQEIFENNNLVLNKRGTKKDTSMVALLEYLSEILEQEEADEIFTKGCFELVQFVMTHGHTIEQILGPLNDLHNEIENSPCS